MEFGNVDILHPPSLQLPSLRLGQGHTDSPLPSLLHDLGFIFKKEPLCTLAKLKKKKKVCSLSLKHTKTLGRR